VTSTSLIIHIGLELSCCSNSQALALTTPRSWVPFPGMARTDKNVNVYLEIG